MSLLATIHLVKSLSSAEKRFFRLRCRHHAGDKSYLDLFNCIDQNSSFSHSEIRKTFVKRYAEASVDNASRYLTMVITDCLVELRIEKDAWFGMLHGIMKAKVLEERSLKEESFRELSIVRERANKSQQHIIELIAYRHLLDQFMDNNFHGLTDKKLVEIQMKARENIRALTNIHDHHSLFELLKYRLLHSGKILSDDNKKQVNDLILSEMTLVAGKSRQSFASQKLHLLFQSFFFSEIGDYRSALKTFHSLSDLFEKNISMLGNPPKEYLFTLNGILESLHTLEHFSEMPFYIEKTELLDKSGYPEHFRFQVRKTVVVYKLCLLVNEKRAAEAVVYIQSFPKGWQNSYSLLDEEKQWELYFWHSLAYFACRDWKKAHAYIALVMQGQKSNPLLLVCRATRLLNIVIYYERNDIDYLKYEVRSYKTFFKSGKGLLKSELLLLRFLNSVQTPIRKKIPLQQQKKIRAQIADIQKGRYERQLLKYFNFTEWVESKVK